MLFDTRLVDIDNKNDKGVFRENENIVVLDN